MIIFRVTFQFARQIKQLKEKIIKPSEEIQTEQKEYQQTQNFEKKFIKSQEFLMASNHLPSIQLPQEILKKARKVFSKYPPDELRDASYKYMRMYQLLHALEKPQAIIIKKNNLFENPENLQKMTDKKIIHLFKKDTNETELWNKIQERRQLKDQETNRIYQAEKKLNEFHNFHSAIDYDQILTVSYFLRKVPGSFSVAQKIMIELQKRNPNFQPQSMLDYGSGVGTWAWSFHKLYPDVQNIVCVDPNIFMRKLGKFVTQDYINNVKFYESLSHTIDYDQFDFISMAYVLEEINQPEARLLTLQSLWTKLSQKGVMVLVCPGSPTGFRFINDFRQWIIQQNGNIIAPCQHSQTCPMAKEGFSWCHFKQMFSIWPKDVFPKYIYENTSVTEKYSYIVVSKTKFEQQLQEAQRIVFDPMKKGQHLIVDLCTINGKIERKVIPKSYGKEKGYYECKHLYSGDLWRFPDTAPNKVGKKRTRKIIRKI